MVTRSKKAQGCKSKIEEEYGVRSRGSHKDRRLTKQCKDQIAEGISTLIVFNTKSFQLGFISGAQGKTKNGVALNCIVGKRNQQYLPHGPFPSIYKFISYILSSHLSRPEFVRKSTSTKRLNSQSKRHVHSPRRMRFV
mmetsp:Transcript_9611/g.26577  ORF Transcript_9611/g.26577 Transcript_9611/m.26577 type:complete len:138 (+) Transcript_9611:2330-2743(+)